MVLTVNECIYIPDGTRRRETKNVVLDKRESEEAFFCIFTTCAIRVGLIAEKLQNSHYRNNLDCGLESKIYSYIS